MLPNLGETHQAKSGSNRATIAEKPATRATLSTTPFFPVLKQSICHTIYTQRFYPRPGMCSRNLLLQRRLSTLGHSRLGVVALHTDAQYCGLEHNTMPQTTK
jgi:hypothetical protein